jgi:hypothetical protein
MPGHKHHSNHNHHRRSENGLNLPIEQAEAHEAGLRHETLIIPSTSQVSGFNGSMVVFDLKEKNVIIKEIALQFNINPITGWTDNTSNYP